MVSEVKWDDRFNIGVEVVDRAHRRLFAIVNKLLAMNTDTDADKNRHACKEGIKFFKNYAIKHFSEEEAYMKSINYKGYLNHKRLHDDLWEITLPALERDLETSSYSLESVRHFLSVCVGWLSGHIMIEDRAITGKVKSRWDSSNREVGIDALEKAIIEYRDSVFEESTQIVSRHFNGEDFGKSLYYRLIYGNEEGRKIQVTLGFEERLIRYSLEAKAGIQMTQTGKIMADTVRDFLQLFVQCVGESFGLTDSYELEKDNFLDRTQFSKLLVTERPEYSLLFDGGYGYFSFSVKKDDI